MGKQQQKEKSRSVSKLAILFFLLMGIFFLALTWITFLEPFKILNHYRFGPEKLSYRDCMMRIKTDKSSFVQIMDFTPDLSKIICVGGGGMSSDFIVPFKNDDNRTILLYYSGYYSKETIIENYDDDMRIMGILWKPDEFARRKWSVNFRETVNRLSVGKMNEVRKDFWPIFLRIMEIPSIGEVILAFLKWWSLSCFMFFVSLMFLVLSYENIKLLFSEK